MFFIGFKVRYLIGDKRKLVDRKVDGEKYFEEFRVVSTVLRVNISIDRNINECITSKSKNNVFKNLFTMNFENVVIL